MDVGCLGNDNSKMAEVDVEVEDASDEIPSLLLPCVSCNRTFRPEALAVHSKVCEKILIKKRKKFDSFKQRVQGTDLAEYLPVLPTFTKKQESSPVRKQSQPNITTQAASKTPLTTKKSKWKEKHNELLQTIHAPTSIVKPSDHERCPFCERSFGPKAYDRHLEWCREQQVRVQPKSPASQRAKERLEARTKYRAPLAARGKQQRSASRDKHGSGLRDPSPAPAPPPPQQQAPRTPATARKKLPFNAASESVSTPNVNMNQNFVKGSALRSSTRTAPAAAKKTTQTRMSRYPRPYSSLRLNPDDVNDQVPEMSVTGFGHREMYLDIPIELDPGKPVPYRLISTYDLDFPDDFLGSTRPNVCGENKSLDSAHGLIFSPTIVEVDKPELNKTYSEDDLKELLEYNPVKATEHEKLPKTRKKVNTGRIKKIPKLELTPCEIYDDLLDKPCNKSFLEQTTLIDLSNKIRNKVDLIDPSNKTTSKIIPAGGNHSQLVQYVTQVSLVPNSPRIVLEVEKLSPVCGPGCSFSSCKSYIICSQAYLPLSFNQINLEFPGVNLIKDSDLFRNYVFFHVTLQKLNEYDGSNDLNSMNEGFGFQCGSKTYKYGSSVTLARMDKQDTSCFTFSGRCSKDSLVEKEEVNLDRRSRNLTSPNKSKQKSKVRSSKTYTKVVHNWWDPTPPKKIKRYLSPDSITTEKSFTSDSGSFTYWDYYDIDKSCGNEAVMPTHAFLDFDKSRKVEEQSPRYSESSSEGHFDSYVKKNKNSKENLLNYYSLCSKATEESSCESLKSRESFEEDSLNQSNESSMYLEEVRFNNKQYYIPYSSKYSTCDIESSEFVGKEKPSNHGRNLEFSFNSGTNRSNELENHPRIYREETTTVEVKAHVSKSKSSTSVHFQSTNTKQNRSSKYNYENLHGKTVGSHWSVERSQVTTTNRYDNSNNLINVKGSSSPDKTHFLKLPQINQVKNKPNPKPVPCAPVKKKIANPKVVFGGGLSHSTVNPSSLNSKGSSKLPVLQHKPMQAGQSNKTHWTNKHCQSRPTNFDPKSTSEEENKPSNYIKMHENLKAFAKAPICKDTDLFNFRRKLSPIAASESISCSKSFSSERSSGYDNVNTSFADDLEELSNIVDDRLYQPQIEQSDNIRSDFPERSTLLTFRVSKEKTFSKPFILPEIPVEKNFQKERCSRCGTRYKQSEREPYDLYKSAEEQMMKLLEPEKELPKPVSAPQTPVTPISPPSFTPPQTPPTPISPPSFTSDISAFTKFTPIQTPTPLFISEDDNANDLTKEDTKSQRSSVKSDSPLTITYDNRSRKDSNENPITLSTLSLCSSISIESVDSNKNGYRMALASSAKVEKKTPVPLRRTVSAFESRKEAPIRKASKGRDPLKGRLKMEDMLYGSSNVEGERYFGSATVNTFLNDIEHGSSGSLEKAVSDAETLTAEQELLKSMSEFEKIYCSTSSSPDQSSQSLKFPSLLSSFPIETTDRFQDIELQPAGHPGNGSDSAYSSLNRKSPVGGEGEGGARFCHECGAKYPLAGAKFCCQCGVRRLIL